MNIASPGRVDLFSLAGPSHARRLLDFARAGLFMAYGFVSKSDLLAFPKPTFHLLLSPWTILSQKGHTHNQKFKSKGINEAPSLQDTPRSKGKQPLVFPGAF